jgi:spore germination protein GerM
MQEHPHLDPKPWKRFWGGFAVAILLSGGMGIAITIHWAMANLTAPEVTTPTSPQTLSQSPQEQRLAIYWLKVTDNRIELAPVPATLDRNQSSQVILAGAIKRLLAGPAQNEGTTTIPEGTQLLDLRLEVDGIHLNLSQEFTSGGGSTSMMGRLAQILYTATSLNPEAAVWLSVEGKPLDVLGGEGLMVDQPLTRKAMEGMFPL